MAQSTIIFSCQRTLSRKTKEQGPKQDDAPPAGTETAKGIIGFRALGTSAIFISWAYYYLFLIDADKSLDEKSFLSRMTVLLCCVYYAVKVVYVLNIT